MAVTDQGGERGSSAPSIEQMLATAIEAFRVGAQDEEVCARLARAETTCALHVGDNGLTALLDRTPIEVLDHPSDDAECHIRGSEDDWMPVFTYGNLGIALAKGELEWSGPVRRFLQVFPIFRTMYAEVARGERGSKAQSGGERPARQPGARSDGPAPTEPDAAPEEPGETRPGGGFSDEQRDLLDQAADYDYHSGALAMDEERSGDFWSVECIDVYKTFGRNRVLNGLNVGIPDGMISVILGPSGTGKSVLIKHLIGLMFPDQGDILVHGRSVPGRRRSELFEMRREFGILFQDGALFGSMNLYDNVAFPLREQTNKKEDEIREIVMRRLEEVGLTEAVDSMPAELSGGMRKRAGFARALVMEPKIVMFDEPDSGLDPVRTALLCDLIKKVHGEHGGTYIVITHDIASARRLGEYIAVLWKGRIVESGDAGDMFESENPFVRQFLGGDADGPLGME
jgi:phospholipid/cholesterol/gamma-HCH transport system ATP-binding protein